MSELVLLGLQIASGEVGRRNFQRNRVGNRQPVTLQPDELPWIVREKPHGLHAEVAENLSADSVIALVRLEPQPLVRLDRIETAVLQLVRADLVRQPDAAAFLIEIQQDPSTFLSDPGERRLELPAAVAARRMKDVSCQAFRVHTDQNITAFADLAA